MSSTFFAPEKGCKGEEVGAVLGKPAVAGLHMAELARGDTNGYPPLARSWQWLRHWSGKPLTTR